MNVDHKEQQRSDVQERRRRQMLLVAAIRAERRGEEEEAQELIEQARTIARPTTHGVSEWRKDGRIRDPLVGERTELRTSLKLMQKARSQVTHPLNHVVNAEIPRLAIN